MIDDCRRAKPAPRARLFIGVGLAVVLVAFSPATMGAVLMEVWQPGDPIILTAPIDGDAIGQGPVAFYDYRSNSAHTGFEIAGASILFVYEYADHLSLFTIHNKDAAGGSGSATQDISGLPGGWMHLQRDDGGGGGTQDTYTPGAGSLLAEWQWVSNTDGSALGLGAVDELIGTEIVVEPSNWSNIDRWGFLGPDGVLALQLDMDRPAHIRFVPEPATMFLLGAGAATGLLRYRRRPSCPKHCIRAPAWFLEERRR